MSLREELIDAGVIVPANMRKQPGVLTLGIKGSRAAQRHIAEFVAFRAGEAIRSLGGMYPDQEMPGMRQDPEWFTFFGPEDMPCQN